ncbi:MAG: glucuronate isomerase, partial [Oscillospiraceae bacterium]|nr:glucuronate isomerase [Oscillospiraceae bacterium]
MKKFMDNDFLLSTETAKELYHSYAAKMPIIDYHCHVSPKEIFEDKHFENISQLWLSGDHYKWRIMRSNGVDEYYITGKASDREKFQKFAEALPKTVGNPMYHWCHLELKKYFGYEGILNGETAEEVWNLCEKKLKEENLGVRDIIKQSNVKFIGTTDDPIDNLEWHEKIAADESFETIVAPSFRPDK